MKLLLIPVMIFAFSAAADNCAKLSPIGPAQKFSDDYMFYMRCLGKQLFTNWDKNGEGFPVAIDMQTGKHTLLEQAANASKSGEYTVAGRQKTGISYTAQDPVPSPDGKLLYVGLSDADSYDLNVYSLSEKPKLLARLHSSESQPFGYPSPATRDGQQLVLYRSDNGLKIASIEVQKDSAALGKIRSLCGNVRGYESMNMPYISGDASYLGAEVDGVMTILKLDWAKANDRSIPCQPTAVLPSGSGKVTFSNDNTRVSFHNSYLDHLGKKPAPMEIPPPPILPNPIDGANPPSNLPAVELNLPPPNLTPQVYQPSPFNNSYIMSLKDATVDRPGSIMPLTNADGISNDSTFPAFCGDETLATRVNISNPPGTEFRLIKAPSTEQIENYARSSCPSPVPADDPAATAR